MRINKEIETLSKKYEVYFLGVGESSDKSFVKPLCAYFELVPGKRNSMKNVMSHIASFLRLTRRNHFHSIHVINEQLMIFFYPFLFGKKVVLDLFDSFFLMHVDKPGNQWSALKRITYAPIHRILVTDENRLRLMNDAAKPRCLIVPNYPKAQPYFMKRSREGKVTIFYNGTMNVDRGTEFLVSLLKADDRVQVIMAGWITDEKTKQLAAMKGVEFRGVMKQDEALKVAAEEADYVLCVYAPNAEIHINASPNKIFDAIQTSTPVIINAEVKVSSFVQEKHIGYVLENYHHYSPIDVVEALFAGKKAFQFGDTLRHAYTWESVEEVLFSAHA
jgi:hypothetical protein